MPNQQIMEYIEKSRQSGVSDEQIRQSLLGAGWSRVLIDEAINFGKFSASSISVGAKVSLGGASLFLIIGILVGAAGVYAYTQYFQKSGDSKKVVQENLVADTTLEVEDSTLTTPSTTDETTTTTDSITTTTVTTTNDLTTSTKTSTITQCGTNKQCLINAAKNCSPATVKWVSSVILFDVLKQDSESSYTIKGLDTKGKCIFVQHVNRVSVSIPADAAAVLKEQGITEEEIAKQVKLTNDSAQSSVGMTNTCTFIPSYLTQMLTNWSLGNFNSKDLASGNCQIIDAKGNVVGGSTLNVKWNGQL